MSYDESILPISIGDYTVRLLTNQQELYEYQRLRYTYLLREFNPMLKDTDALDLNGGYDNQTSQLCVFHLDPQTKKQTLVGGYILMRFKNKDSFCKTKGEFDISKLIEGHSRQILEISRVVIHPDHRNGVVLKLLWEGIEAYIQKYNLRYIIGTVSFKGTNPQESNHAISYLFHNYLMQENIMAFGKDTIPLLDIEEVDKMEVRRQLPPILRGYLLQGCHVGKGLYIDYEFNSVDVFVIMDAENKGKYKLK